MRKDFRPVPDKYLVQSLKKAPSKNKVGNIKTGDLVTKWWVTQVCSRLQNVFDDNITYEISCGVLEADDTSKS